MPTDTYQLLDSGREEKLEQVGAHRLVRPCPQAVWHRRRPAADWADVDAVYVRSSSGGGQWECRRPLPPAWEVRLHGRPWQVKPTGFGHLGIFPEQEANWRWLQQQCRRLPDGAAALNLFAYTGGSTLAMAHAGARATHLDAARGVVNWARDNARLQDLAGAPIHWITEDVTRFCQRERRREHRYRGIVLDPPSFGRGPGGELWKIEGDLLPLLETCRDLLEPAGPAFLLLSCHSPGFSPLVLDNLLRDLLAGAGHCEAAEMVVPEEGSGRVLPSGCCARWTREG
jgi:23S rRNA (cytosine1962-C5)-methyltransferase